MPLRSLLGLGLAFSLAWAGPLRAQPAAPLIRYVELDGTRLLATPSAFGRTLAKLPKGTVLRAWPAGIAYLRVSVSVGGAAKQGYIALRSLSERRPRLTANAHASADASAQEMAAATKGFNQQIEDDRRAKDTTGGYKRLDIGLARTRFDHPLAETEAFRREGGLGEFKEGGR